jgi:hypothetical protein
MTRTPTSFGPLSLRVKEPSPGLFFWVLTQLSAQEHISDVCLDTSDHPYPSHEAAMQMGMACLKAYQAQAQGIYVYESFAPAMAAARWAGASLS